MGTILIDELLAECVARDAGELHLTPGHPPMMRVGGRLQAHGAEPPGAADMRLLMEYVTPAECVRELYEGGDTAFEFGFGDASRFGVSVSRRKGGIELVMKRVGGTRLAGK